MLENLPGRLPLTTAALGSLLGRFLSRFGSFGTNGSNFAQTPHGGSFKSSRRTAGSFSAAVNGIAEHFRYRLGSANEMDLESVRLFFCTSFRVNTPDVLL
jgi:hypothetical protein